MLKTVLLAACIASAIPSHAQGIRPLEPKDFVVAGISENMNSSAVRKILGKPITARSWANPVDYTDQFVEWSFEGITVVFNSSYEVYAITITTTRFTTQRGLKVGDPVVRIRQLYGEATTVDESEADSEGPLAPPKVRWNYRDPTSKTRLLSVVVQSARVYTISLGGALD